MKAHNQHWKIVIIALVWQSIFLAGCESDTSSSSSNTPSSLLGSIAGDVRLYDTTWKQLPDQSGVKVSLLNTTYFTKSDAKGRWKMSDIASGTYTLVFSKEGFGDRRVYNVVVTGNGTYYLDYKSSPVSMHVIPTIITSLVVRSFENDIADFSSKIPPNYGGSKTYVAFYFHKSENIDPLDPTKFVLHELSDFHRSQDTSIHLNISKARLLLGGFVSGERAYCQAYGFNSQCMESQYWDFEYDKTIFTSLSRYPSEIKSFIVP